MSKCSIWIKASNHRFYKDPVVADESVFLSFDDDEPPEVVMKSSGNLADDRMSKHEFFDRVKTWLAYKGIEASIISYGSTAQRIFGNQLDPSSWEFFHARSAFIKIHKFPFKVLTSFTAKSFHIPREGIIWIPTKHEEVDTTKTGEAA